MPNPDSVRNYSIGEMARRADTKVQTIRYYEQIGLMPAPPRTAGNQRRYNKKDLQRLQFIRHARAFGFRVVDIRDLLALADQPEHSCAQADELARKQLQSVEARIRGLERLRQELARMITQCDGGHVHSCRVIQVLADHELCAGEH